LANGITKVIKEQRTDNERAGRLHLFYAAPNSFAFFLGRLSPSFGAFTLYEYDFEKNLKGAYLPSISLPPTSRINSILTNSTARKE
jgi:hypothetical protein